MKLLLTSYLLMLIYGTITSAQQFFPNKEPVDPAGDQIICDIPPSQHMRNTGGWGPRGAGTGAGLCCFTSIEMVSRWQNIPELTGFQKWMTYKNGGGWPEKIDAMIAQFTKEKGASVPLYLQHTGGDESFLDAAIKTDRMLCVTYAGVDDFYNGTIAHMVCLVGLTDKWAVIYDNNRPGVVVGMSRSDFLKRWRANGGGWAIVFLNPPPPPHLPAKNWLVQKTMPIPLFSSHYIRYEVLVTEDEAMRMFRDDSTVPTQCQNGCCRSVTGPAPIGNAPSGEYEWGVCFDGRWGWKLKEKQKFEAPQPKVEAEIENYGIDTSKIHQQQRYTLPDGSCVPKGRAHALIAGAEGLPDDSGKWHLTIVGDDAYQAKVKAILDKVGDDKKNKLHIQFYTQDRWEVKSFDLPKGISLRKPSPVRTSEQVGVITADDLSLNDLLELLKLIDGIVPKPAPTPNSRPNPDPNTPAPTPTPTPINWPFVIVGLAVLYWLFKKKETN